MSERKANEKVSPSDLLDVVPRDVMDKTPIIYLSTEPVWVGLKIEDILGSKAAETFAYYRFYTEHAEHLDEKLAIETEAKFKSIAGFTPTNVLEAMHQKEEEYGFDTRDLSPNLLNKTKS